MNGIRSAARSVVALAFAAHCAQPVLGQAADKALGNVSIDDLKAVYLWCDDRASHGRLDTASIMQCSIVSEALRSRAFDGSFDRLMAWADSQRTRPPIPTH